MRSSSPLTRIEHGLRRLPDVLLLVIGLALVAGVVALDATMGRDVPMVEFYLVPVAVVGWLARSLWYGFAVAVAAAACDIAVSLSVTDHPSTSLVVAAGAARLLLYLIILGLLKVARRVVEERDDEALTDAQTGLANARGLTILVRMELERCRRYHHELSLLYMDVDEFKGVNDRLGHVEGDRLLLVVAHVSRTSVRTVDTVARLGGDEFVVFMPETGPAEARVLAERVRGEIGRISTLDGEPVTCSIGLISLHEAPDCVSDLLHAGDRVMYKAKATGRGAIVQESL
jgi:diguanylate cyclase (GGDEF)-like protein